jgi:hypothetical protein
MDTLLFRETAAMLSVRRRRSESTSTAVNISFSHRDEILGRCEDIFKLLIRNTLSGAQLPVPFESLRLGIVTSP